MPNPTLSIIIPCYKSDASLNELIERVEATIQKHIKVPYEILLIDDGSPTPDTWARIVSLTQSYAHIRGFKLMRNFGKSSAEMCGYQNMRGQFSIQMDDDLQHPPEEMTKLWNLREHDVVMGNFPTRQHGLFAKLSSRLANWFAAITIGKPKHIYTSPYRLIRREVIDAITKINTPYPSGPALLFFATQDIAQIDIKHDKRKYGRSTYTFWKKVKQFSNLLINNSSFLLRAIALLGITFAALSICFALYLILQKLLFGTGIQGWTSIMVVLMLIGGMIMCALGIVGEYLIRIINGTENKPAFIVREEITS